MKILNLVDPEKSEIKYKKILFPDGQQNITIDITQLPKDYTWFLTNGGLTYSVQIKSRLNNWLDLELITCAVASLKELGVKEIHLYTPYIMGARSDRKFEEGGNNYLRDVICPVINALGCKTVTCIDPHSDVLEACIKGFRKESNLELVEYAINDIYNLHYVKEEDKGVYLDNYIMLSPDAGASKKIYKLAEQIGYKGNIITCSKDRDENGKLTKVIVPTFVEPAKKDIVIIDDICDGGGTFINIAKAIKEACHNNKIYLIVTHGIFSKGYKELCELFDGIYITNSYSDFRVFKDSDVQYQKKVKHLNVF